MGKFGLQTMNQGQVIADLNAKIAEAGLDIQERPEVTGKRVITCKITLDPREQYVGVEVDMNVTLPKAPAVKSFAFMGPDGSLVTNTEIQNVLRPLPGTEKKQAAADGGFIPARTPKAYGENIDPETGEVKE